MSPTSGSKTWISPRESSEFAPSFTGGARTSFCAFSFTFPINMVNFFWAWTKRRDFPMLRMTLQFQLWSMSEIMDSWQVTTAGGIPSSFATTVKLSVFLDS